MNQVCAARLYEYLLVYKSRFILYNSSHKRIAGKDLAKCLMPLPIRRCKHKIMEFMMQLRKRVEKGFCGWLVSASVWGGMCCHAASASDAAEHRMPSVIEQFTADRMSLTRTYSMPISPARIERFEKFYRDELTRLDAMNFDQMPQNDKIDYLLLKNRLTAELHQLAIQKQQVDEMQPPLPFAGTIENLLDRKRLMLPPDGEKAAAAFSEMVKQINAKRKELDSRQHGEHSTDGGEKPKVNPVVANRAVNATRELSDALKEWFNQYNNYDPVFTWWVAQPYKDVAKALTDYSAFLKEKVIGIAPDDKTTIIGDPVGRDALMQELSDALIPYTPEELMAIAETEYDWCMKEML